MITCQPAKAVCWNTAYQTVLKFNHWKRVRSFINALGKQSAVFWGFIWLNFTVINYMMLSGPSAYRLRASCIDLQDTQFFHTHLPQPPHQSSENYMRSPFFLHPVTAQTDNQHSFCWPRLPLHWTFCLEVFEQLHCRQWFSGRFKSRSTCLFHWTFSPLLLLSASATEVPRHTGA